MDRRIKLIWDFFGDDSKKTAEHHAIHLNEFAKMKGLENTDSGSEEITGQEHLAFIVVGEEHMILVRDSLRPKRGQWVEQ
tara:strand:+ start:11762 stop:12001 length:240 start_codon:yes stop_codon:yes gene_type:complete